MKKKQYSERKEKKIHTQKNINASHAVVGHKSKTFCSLLNVDKIL